MWETLLTEKRDGVLTVTLNRPEVLNAFDERMTRELAAILKEAAQDTEVRCLVLTGAGRAFSSGQDLAALKDQYAAGARPRLGERLRRGYGPVIRRLRRLEKPVVAAVNGVAAGAGASVAFACDLRLASEKAAFVLAFVKVGLVPDSGSTYFLPRLVGLGKAMELCFTGEKVEAAEALRLGLVHRVVPPAELPAAARALAARLAALPTRALGLTKRLLAVSYGNTLEEQLELEAYHQETAGLTEDHREGVQAFLEKREPKFRGK